MLDFDGSAVDGHLQVLFGAIPSQAQDLNMHVTGSVLECTPA